MLDSATMDWHLLAQEIMLYDIIKTYPKVDFDVFGSPDQLVSEYPWEVIFIGVLELLYLSSISIVACRYWGTLFATFQCAFQEVTLNLLSALMMYMLKLCQFQ